MPRSWPQPQTIHFLIQARIFKFTQAKFMVASSKPFRKNKQTSINTRQTQRRENGTYEIRFLFFLNLFLLFSHIIYSHRIFIACHTSTITHLHLDVRPIYDYYLCMNMHQSHRYIFISRTNNQLSWIKEIPKLLLFFL